MKKFWMVYVEGGDTPKIWHETKASAWDEAERIARKTHRPVYVLEVVACCTTTIDISWTEL